MLKKLIVSILSIGLILSLSSIVGAEKIKITRMISANMGAVAKPMETAFEKEFPNYDLEFIVKPDAKYHETLWTWAIAGQLPDLFSTFTDWRIEEYINAGILLPIDGLVRELNLDLSIFPDWALHRVTRKGKLYGMPYDINVAGGYINYNKKVFDEVGISYPTSEMTWEGLADLARKLTVRNEKGEVTRYGIFCKWPAYYLFPWFGARIVDDPGSPKEMLFGHAPFVTATQWYRDLVDEGVMMDRQTYSDWGGSKPKLFFEEKFAMIITGMGYSGGFREVDYDVELLPRTVENFECAVGVNVTNIGSQCENPKAALEYIWWRATSVAAMEVWQAYIGDNGCPPLLPLPDVQAAFEEIAKGKKPENWKCVYDVIPFGMSGSPGWDGGAEIMARYNDAMMDVVLGKRPVSYLVEAEAECQKMLDEFNRDK